MKELYQKALNGEFLSLEEGLKLYTEAPFSELIFLANEIKKKNHPQNIVTWQIDRNVNITNVCVSFCKFCNFCRKKSDSDTYITQIEEYKEKIDELYKLGGNQLLLQGGLHPELGLSYYKDLFSSLKEIYPDLRLHALGPPEIDFISKMEGLSHSETLISLKESGLASLPGAGAEILVDRVRKIVSPAKCDTDTWLEIMRQAHKLDMTTSATMMFGHVETNAERIEHLIRIRETQEKKPEGSKGFLAFICWPFMDEGTRLREKKGVISNVSSEEYLRTIAISRIMLPNVKNIQASWLTVGIETGQTALYCGANDLGSIMIEENVVSSAGVRRKMDAKGMQEAIKEAGFEPKLRDQDYNLIAN